MANLKDIRMRIESTKNTQQITKAMKLVSAAKLRKAQNNITNMRPYAVTLPRTYKSTGGPLPLIVFLPGKEDGKLGAPAEFFTK